MTDPVDVMLEAFDVVVHERGVWCDGCLLPAAIAVSFTLACRCADGGGLPHQVGSRVEWIVLCECGHQA